MSSKLPRFSSYATSSFRLVRFISQKRLHRQLTRNVISGSQVELEETLKRYEEFKLPADELYYRAVRKVEYLRLKNGLREAVRRRHYSTLRDAIEAVEASPFANELPNSTKAARQLLDELAYQWSGEPVQHSMGYSSISEVRRFKSPPGCVIDSVKACFLLVGTPPAEVKTWPMMRALLCRTGRDSLLVQMATFDPGRLSLKLYKTADTLVRRWSEREVSAVSFEAGTFWAWANSSLNRKYNQIGRKPKK
ncbi:kyphoscoliosis peptidase [Plakobranchus ocellatus]|uniref:Kyphoscoliosis peptidase n=1 Tax=Plakobranchus ocellatus TaxID=259542 RepID=A0AAV4CGX8_9GAST|nr:kyphoscoliosis peptidase [Plakobranchus ocellatus]